MIKTLNKYSLTINSNLRGDALFIKECKRFDLNNSQRINSKDFFKVINNKFKIYYDNNTISLIFKELIKVQNSNNLLNYSLFISDLYYDKLIIKLLKKSNSNEINIDKYNNNIDNNYNNTLNNQQYNNIDINNIKNIINNSNNLLNLYYLFLKNNNSKNSTEIGFVDVEDYSSIIINSKLNINVHLSQNLFHIYENKGLFNYELFFKDLTVSIIVICYY